MPEDLVHIQRHIQKNLAEIDDYRSRMNVALRQADDYHNRNEETRATFFDQEAMRYRQKAEQLEKENEQHAANEKAQQQKHTELVQKREKMVNEFNSQLAALDREIEQISGTSLSL